jgi:hypothetical protein
MKLTFSTSADSILSRSRDFQNALLKALEHLPGHGFVEGKVGRIAGNDEIVLMCQGHDPITVTQPEFKNPATISRIAEEWSRTE